MMTFDEVKEVLGLGEVLGLRGRLEDSGVQKHSMENREPRTNSIDNREPRTENRE